MHNKASLHKAGFSCFFMIAPDQNLRSSSTSGFRRVFIVNEGFLGLELFLTQQHFPIYIVPIEIDLTAPNTLIKLNIQFF